MLTIAWVLLSLIGLVLAVRSWLDSRAQRADVRRGPRYRPDSFLAVVAQGNLRRSMSRVVLLQSFLVLGLVALLGPSQVSAIVFTACLLLANIATVYGTVMDQLDRRRLQRLGPARQRSPAPISSTQERKEQP